MKITAEQELSLIMEMLTQLNVPGEDASIVAEVTLDADLKGFSSHGLGGTHTLRMRSGHNKTRK